MWANLTDLHRLCIGSGGTLATAAKAGAEHPATIAAAGATALFMLVSTFYKIRNGGK